VQFGARIRRLGENAHRIDLISIDILNPNRQCPPKTHGVRILPGQLGRKRRERYLQRLLIDPLRLDRRNLPNAIEPVVAVGPTECTRVFQVFIVLRKLFLRPFQAGIGDRDRFWRFLKKAHHNPIDVARLFKANFIARRVRQSKWRDVEVHRMPDPELCRFRPPAKEQLLSAKPQIPFSRGHFLDAEVR
jgi:hypothetical protein